MLSKLGYTQRRSKFGCWKMVGAYQEKLMLSLICIQKKVFYFAAESHEIAQNLMSGISWEVLIINQLLTISHFLGMRKKLWSVGIENCNWKMNTIVAVIKENYKIRNIFLWSKDESSCVRQASNYLHQDSKSKKAKRTAGDCGRPSLMPN